MKTDKVLHPECQDDDHAYLKEKRVIARCCCSSELLSAVYVLRDCPLASNSPSCWRNQAMQRTNSPSTERTKWINQETKRPQTLIIRKLKWKFMQVELIAIRDKFEHQWNPYANPIGKINITTQDDGITNSRYRRKFSQMQPIRHWLPNCHLHKFVPPPASKTAVVVWCTAATWRMLT